jgi:phosphoribosylanthranilate isomerase
MIDGIRFKVCGITTLVDADFADASGADYLGFNLFPQSPRYVPLTQYQGMSALLPERKRVAVCVEPTPVELMAMQAAEFDYFQVHFRAHLPVETVAAWSEVVGRDRLWLAPKLPPEADVADAWLPLADTMMLDTFHADKFGGSGKTGDWTKFVRHREAHPNHRWLLAGGLSPENIAGAVRATGARFVDVNSGVETSPGVKDEAKLKRFTAELHRARPGL